MGQIGIKNYFGLYFLFDIVNKYELFTCLYKADVNKFLLVC